MIVDLSCDVAGRFAAKLFAMSGTAVVRPVLAGDEAKADALSIYLDAGKTIVACPDTDAVALLLRDAAVVFTSFDRGEYVGLSSAVAVPSPCVQVTTSTFGASGPYAAYRGGPLAEWAAGGYLAITGAPDRAPLMGPENLCGYAAGYTAAIAAEAGLRLRARTGRGHQVDVSTMEAMLAIHQSSFSRASAGLTRRRTGRYTEVYPLVVRPCRDGYVSLGVVTDLEFDRLMIACGRPDLAADDRFKDRAGRWQHCNALDDELSGFLLSHDGDEIVAILQANAVAAAKVASPREVLDNPQLAFREFWSAGGKDGAARMPGNPVRAARRFARPRGDETSHRPWPALRTDTGALPLSGINVLDLTAFWAGPSATRCLADLGAEVIWVERPRSRPNTPADASNANAIMQHLYAAKMYRNKRSVVLDLETADGRAAAQQLAGQADILVENFRPGTASKLGLDPAALCAAHPRLIYVSLSGFGSGGPWGDWRSYGPTIEAASSIQARTGYAGGEPLRLGHTLPDGIGGLVGTLAALRGLRERTNSGCGGWFDLSQLEAYTAICGEDILRAATGAAFPRVGNRARPVGTWGAIQGVFPCRGEDRWIAIRLSGVEDTHRFAALTGLPGFAEAASLSVPYLDGIEAAIAGYTRAADRDALSAQLQDAGLEAFPVLTPNELLNDAHLRARGFFVGVPIAGRDYFIPGTPLRGADLAAPRGIAPDFGQHTAEVLGRLTR